MPESVQHDAPLPVQVQELSRQRLYADFNLLKAVYGLLVSAHYRTRPSDLRQLMEDENQQLYIALHGDAVVGVLQLNHEGGFQPEICEEVFMGRRRPPGHLFAQMITAQAGIRDFACHRGERIQRITVHEHFRRMGIGRALIEKATENQGAYLSAAFALDVENALFWSHLGFQLVHIGAGRGKSTGRQTLAMLKPDTPEVERAMHTLQQRIRDNLPLWLLTYCNNLGWREVLVLLKMLVRSERPDAFEVDEIEAFSNGFRGLEFSQAALQKLVFYSLSGDPGLTEKQQQLLIEKILLNRSWSQLTKSAGLSGRKQINREIRKGVKVCYEYSLA